MGATDWIKAAKRAGWRVTPQGSALVLQCSRQGCSGRKVLPVDNLGNPPEPCALPHQGQYAGRTLGDYKALVGSLIQRRKQLGLSQEDVTEAAGLADGHINKLEALHRYAQFPTLHLWAQTLGLEITLYPAPIPPKTMAVIDGRAKPLRKRPTPKALL